MITGGRRVRKKNRVKRKRTGRKRRHPRCAQSDGAPTALAAAATTPPTKNARTDVIMMTMR